jgi:hypothetical protein
VRARRVDPATIGAADPLAGAPPIAMAARERLSGLAPVPGDGCDLLLARAGGGGRVVATGGAGEPMLLTALPARFRAGAASVCRRHLLVAGARPRHGRPAGALAVVPLGTHG